MRGVLTRQIFQSEDRFYTVAVLRTHPDSREETLAGDLGGCEIGDTIEVEGTVFEHPRFGRQIRELMVRWIPPVTSQGTRKFLASGQVPGVGAKIAGRIVDRFGADTWRVLDEEPDRLAEIEGIGKGRARGLAEAWRECRQRFEDSAFLSSLGLGPVLASRVREKFGEDASRTIKRRPYSLVHEIEGIGFQRADEIARRLEVSSSAPERIAAALVHVSREQADHGHTYTPRSMLVERAAQLLGLARGPVEDGLQRMLEQRELIAEDIEGDQAVFHRGLHAVEVEVARELRARTARRSSFELPVEESLRWVEPRLGFELTPAQRRALEVLLSHPTVVLTGGPGVGKTTIVKALTLVYEHHQKKVALAAPTGRAARRLEEACGTEARTMHRLLRFIPRTGRFEHDAANPLPYDVVLVDEASMVDLPLTRALLRGLDGPARFVLVGDADQLPSVGPGDVLRSVVESGLVPVVRLDQILRQKEGSSIVQAAHTVLKGQRPAFQTEPGDGAFFAARDDAGRAQSLLLDMVRERLPRGYGLDPLRDVQVLTPMHRGPLGTRELNVRLKRALNPTPDDVLGPGDRVLQTRNDYELEVFNGEIGTVLSASGQAARLPGLEDLLAVDKAEEPRDGKRRIAQRGVGGTPSAPGSASSDEGKVLVQFDDRRVEYSVSAARSLQLAYAISVHKSQGCEFPVVVLVVHDSHRRMLRRNLLYTAITRARRVLVTIGSERALLAAVEVGAVDRRRSLLQRRLAANDADSMFAEPGS